MFEVCTGFSPVRAADLDDKCQGGEPRTSANTLTQVEIQVRAACLGVASTVDKLQTDTGVKDAFTQYWIENLIGRARNLKKAHPQWRPVEIQEELMVWVNENKAIIYNLFLTLKGGLPIVVSQMVSNIL